MKKPSNEAMEVSVAVNAFLRDYAPKHKTGSENTLRSYETAIRMFLTYIGESEGVSECAFVTRVFWRGNAIDQLQLHLMGPSGTYRIDTVCFDDAGNEIAVDGVLPSYETGCAYPTFAIVKPAVDNTRVDMSPYGQSVFADAVDAVQAADLAFDCLMNELDIGKMRIFLSDVMFDKESSGKGKPVSIPFDKNDCTVFRKVMSSEDMIQEFAQALRTNAQAEAFRIALEVSLCTIARAVMGVSRTLGVALPDEGAMRCEFDDSIISDTAAEKKLAMAEVGVTMHPWEYRVRFYGESEDEPKENARGLEVGAVGDSGASVA